MKSSDKTKLIIAIVILILAGITFAWSQGWIFSGGAATTPPPVEPESIKSGGPRTAPGLKK